MADVKSEFYVDVASGKDWSTECEAKRHPDGTIEIVAFRQWKHEIDLSPSPVAASSDVQD